MGTILPKEGRIMKKGYVCTAADDGKNWFVEPAKKSDLKEGTKSVFKNKEHAKITATVVSDFWNAPTGADKKETMKLKIWMCMIEIMKERGIEV